MCGSHEFYRACRDNDIEPILGEEFYFSRHERGANSPDRYHIVILGKGYNGYKALSELSTAAHSNFYYKPLLTRDMLEGQKDIVVLSGCAASVISQLIQSDELEEAEAELLWWKNTIPDFYLELQHHNNDFDRKINTQLVLWGKKHKIPWVITNDPHYAVEEDCSNHDVLLALQTASNIDDPSRFRFNGEGYWLKDAEEMKATFKEYGPMVWKVGAENTVKIAEDCHTRIPEWEERKWFLPKFPDVEDSFGELRKLVIQGLKKKKVYNNLEYRDRAIYELGVIKKVGIADFLLIARDCVKWAESQDIPVGPGRGSVSGSLVCWLISIHKVDSIRYNCMFERFLNPARPKMPDIDIDFGPKKRESLFLYVTEKYGERNVMHFATFQRMKTKATFQALAKAYGIPFQEATAISKTLDPDSETPNLPPVITENYPEIAAQLEALAGTKKSISTHPAGVIIADPEIQLKTIVPQMWIPSTKKWVAQYPLTTIEKMGLMKQDFLGLRNLDTIDECIKLVPELSQAKIDAWIPDQEPYDKQIYAMLAKGDTTGVFQLEGDTCRSGIKQMGCQSFEDISACISLYRAGPLAAGYPERFIHNRELGKDKIEYPHPMLKEILEPTWGVAIYQEQVMTIVEELGGFDMILVDDFKEAIRFKSKERMQPLQERFLGGATERGMDYDKALAYWEELQDFYTYAYNRCLTGDTVVYRAATNQYDPEPSITLQEVYERYISKTPVGDKYRYQGFKILAYDGTNIRPAKFKAIYNTGIQDVYQITLENGMSIKSTKVHRHLSTSGYKRTDELKLQDALLVMGEKEKAITANGIGHQWNKPEMPKRIASDGRNRPFIHGHSSDLNAIKRILPNYCEFCGATKGRLEAAHLDHNRSNNTRDNVKKLCNTCHKRWDKERRGGKAGPRFTRDFPATAQKIVAIEYVGKQQTYDVEMDSVEHNFVANGIITHNCHSIAYSLITYQTARLKYLYPLEYYAAALRTIKEKDKRLPFLVAASDKGFKILPPDVNKSDLLTKPEDGSLRLGYCDINKIGEKTGQKVIDARGSGFQSYEEFAKVANKTVVNNMTTVGALKCFGIPGDIKQMEELLGWSFHDRMAKVRQHYANDVILPEDQDEEVMIIGEVIQKISKTTQSKKPYQVWTVRWSPSQSFKCNLWSPTKELWSTPVGSIVKINGSYQAQWSNIGVASPKQIKVLKSAS